MIEDIICKGGVPAATCCCGRYHFARLADDYEERVAMADTPADVLDIPHFDEDSIGVGTFNGAVVVHGCRCGWAGTLEEVLDGNTKIIFEYFHRKAKAEAKASMEAANALRAVTPDEGKPKK